MNLPDNDRQNVPGNQDDLEGILFHNPEQIKEKELLLEEYKLFVETSEKLVARRQTVNNFFLSVNILVCSGIGLVAKEVIDTPLVALGAMIIVLGGILLCWAWLSLLHSYKQLNTGKFEIIYRLEKQLPVSLFEAEWKALGEGGDDQKYKPFTKTEKTIPIIFIVFYLLTIAVGGVYLFLSLDC